ncbi:hypothetical protein KCP74_01400 [Salmonella enterica subsp. enterica]|nr:hypothetical protein KCP74_01400 [Salmonella enterica subsp. enterica]
MGLLRSKIARCFWGPAFANTGAWRRDVPDAPSDWYSLSVSNVSHYRRVQKMTNYVCEINFTGARVNVSRAAPENDAVSWQVRSLPWHSLARLLPWRRFYSSARHFQGGGHIWFRC